MTLQNDTNMRRGNGMSLDRREFLERAMAVAAVNGDFDVEAAQGRVAANFNADRARNVFSAFRRTIRPGMLWGPFVSDLTYELYNFYKAMLSGERPKLAISVGPQHGKSWAAEDFIAWLAGRNPDLKTIYASYSDELGVMRNLNLQRLITSDRYQSIFPHPNNAQRTVSVSSMFSEHTTLSSAGRSMSAPLRQGTLLITKWWTI